MRLKRTRQYEAELINIIRYIHQDKPSAAKNFKDELDKRLIGILENPYMYRASIYADDKNVRDMVFKGYTIVYEIGDDAIVILDIFKWVGRALF